MSSYRHASHAGNPADVLKHLVLAEILYHLRAQGQPFTYIDTHAGAGIYRLDTPPASNRREYETGIARLIDTGEPELQTYLKIIRHFNADGCLRRYPGSPKIAAYLMAPGDEGWLFELDPGEFATLRKGFPHTTSFHLKREDGYPGLIRLLPPASKRGCILIDPPYEAAQEYEQAVACLVEAHRCFAAGTYIIWYPVIERSAIEWMENRLHDIGPGPIQRFELQHAEPHPGRPWASGLFVINPPASLFPRMQGLLPVLAERLGERGVFGFRCEELTPA